MEKDNEIDIPEDIRESYIPVGNTASKYRKTRQFRNYGKKGVFGGSVIANAMLVFWNAFYSREIVLAVVGIFTIATTLAGVLWGIGVYQIRNIDFNREKATYNALLETFDYYNRENTT